MRISASGLLLLWMAVATVPALSAPQAPESVPAAPPAPAAPAPLSMVELSRELDRIASTVAEVEAALAAPADLAGAQRALDAIEPQLAGRLAEAAPAALVLLSPIGQDSLAEALKRLADAVAAARAPLDARAAGLERGREIVRTGSEVIRQVRSGPQAADVPEALRARTRALESSLERLRAATVRALDAVVIQADRASDMQQRIATALADIDAAYRADAAATLAPDQPPLWQSLSGRGLTRIDFRESVVETWSSAADMARTYPQRSFIALLLLGLVTAGLLMLRRVAMHAGTEAAAGQLFVRRPLAAAVLIWAVLAPDLADLRLPAGLGMLRIVLVVGAAWPLLPLMVPASVRLPLRSLLLLSVVGTWMTLLLGGHAAGSLGFVLIGAASWLLLRRLAAAYAALAATAMPPRLLGVSRLALATGQLLVAAGLVAIVIGYVRLGRQLVEGVLLFALLPVVLAVLSQVLGEIWDQLLERPALRRLHAVRDYPAEVSRRGHQLVNLALLFLALPVVVRVFPFSAPLWEALGEFAGAKLQVGGISLSVLDLLAFAIGIALAVSVARFTRFVLDEDVLTRLPLASGARAAASRLIYYLLLTVGMLMALAASGFQLSQLTLVVSALGVGIGFGLQNIVNNFVSGIVLAFERPFQAGDLIAVGQSTGRVSDIGLRATTVRTLEGADVIVPNSTFISGEVINWTLSDRMRRIQLAIGVAYGSDPRQVQALLLEVCARTPDVATEPAPVVALTGFGDSALNFQVLAWTPDADRLLITTSALAMGIYDSLNAAGISIPFPQREVRLLPPAPPPPAAGA
jgi:potassium efflux system protein